MSLPNRLNTIKLPSLKVLVARTLVNWNVSSIVETPRVVKWQQYRVALGNLQTPFRNYVRNVTRLLLKPVATGKVPFYLHVSPSTTTVGLQRVEEEKVFRRSMIVGTLCGMEGNVGNLNVIFGLLQMPTTRSIIVIVLGHLTIV